MDFPCKYVVVVVISDLTPDRPRNVRAKIKTPTSLFVEWDPVPPKKNADVVGYSVHYCNVDGEYARRG